MPTKEPVNYKFPPPKANHPPTSPDTIPKPPAEPPSRKTYLLTALAFTLFAIVNIGVFSLYQLYRLRQTQPQTYEQCVTTPGSKIRNTLPPVCISQSGKRFSPSIPNTFASYTPTPEPPTPTPTIDISSWQTYANDQLGFSVKYPSDWTISEFSRDQAYIGKTQGVALRPNIKTASDRWGITTIEVEENINHLSIDEFIDQHLCENQESCTLVQDATPETISNTPAKRVINPPGPLPAHIVITTRGQHLYLLYTTLDKTMEQQYSTQRKITFFDQILSTFQFLD